MNEMSDLMSEATEARLPQPEDITSREKEDAMGAYLMMFAAWGIGLPLPLFNMVAAVIYHFVNKKNSPFVAFHSLQSLISQIPVSVLNAGLVVWLIIILAGDMIFPTAFFVFLIFAVLCNILYIIFSFIALYWAKKGCLYYMPFFGKLAFIRYYGPEAQKRKERVIPANRPPKGF